MRSARLPPLLDAVREVPHPRTAHLVTHSWPMLLGLVACAMLYGTRSVRGVLRRAHGQGAGIIAALEVAGASPRIPARGHLAKALARVDGDALDAAVGRFVQAHTADPLADVAGDPSVPQLAVAGMTVRGAKDPDGQQVRLLGVCLTDPGVMLAQREMRHKPHDALHFSAALNMVAEIIGPIVSATHCTPSPATPAT
ncbi:hypothetical protein ABZT06_27955 [Streptomyces sp. NPDC005483]|uniref:hypothetical protein n=1 Tax=Streptomyces sp. NPDC005483 TaxID=3154882 RepID=UPI0033BA2A0C